jgi:two-component system sensor histidine kinase CiaH
MQLFRSTTAKLTAWYTGVLIILCLLFSGIVFTIARQEIGRPLRLRYGMSLRNMPATSESLERLRANRVNEGTRRLATNLILFNMVILTTGSVASYFVARRTLQPIEDALAAQVRFSSDAAHELRTPLSIMRSEIEVALRNSNNTKQDYATILRSNLDEVDRLESLTNRLLLLASGKQLELLPTSLEEIAIEAVNRVIPLAQAKQITVNNTVGPKMVRANADSLMDVVTILLDNAIKYCPSGSNIMLSAGQKGRMAFIAVHDNGPGISREAQKHIFERFYRVDTSRARHDVAGHGLGLSIAQALIKAHSGKITVASNKENGTVFTVYIHTLSDKLFKK